MVNIKKVSASADAVLAGIQNIKKIKLVAGSAAATLITFNGATQSGGTDMDKLAAVTGDTRETCFGEEGYHVEAGISMTISGTGAVAYVWY